MATCSISDSSGRALVRNLMLVGRTLAIGAAMTCALRAPLVGQELRGRVLEAGSEQAVAGALVQLMAEGEVEASALSDSSGVYRLSTPGPGDYRLRVEAYGYGLFRSHLLAVGERDSYSVDVELAPQPVSLEGVRVTADRLEALERGLRLEIGIHPRSLRNEPFLRPRIDEHLEKGHGVTQVMRWANLPSIVTLETNDGPCFKWRNRQCLPVYVNGEEVTPALVPVVPLEMIEMMLVLTPGEAIEYIQGAVLLYTSEWIR